MKLTIFILIFITMLFISVRNTQNVIKKELFSINSQLNTIQLNLARERFITHKTVGYRIQSKR